MLTPKKLSIIVDALKDNGGITINEDYDRVMFIKGYQVSIDDMVKIPMSAVSTIVLAILLETVHKELERTQREHIGLWVDNGTLYIDLSIRVLDLYDAMRIGAHYNQKAIYDWANCKSLEL